MTMKKRFLGLALAAMVAVPATTAYASNRVTIQGQEGRPLTQEVTVNGTVNTNTGLAPEGKIEVELPTTLSFTVDKNGSVQGANYEVTNKVTVNGTVNTNTGLAPEGKIEVELPTTLSFTVDKNGSVQGANYEVTNNSSKSVIVSVKQFVDTTPTDGHGITVKKGNELQPDTDTRDKVSLALVGAPVPGNASTTSVDLMSIKSSGDDILGVESNSTSIMNLIGTAGRAANGTVDTNGVSDTFKLVFNVRADS